MNVHVPTRVITLAGVGAIALASFAGGALWNQSVTPVAAEEPGTPPAAQQRGWLGIGIAAITDELAAKLGITKQDGLAVTSVVTDSPAAKAGVQAKDVIKTINGAAATDLKATMEKLRGIKPGDTVTLGISRNGASQTIGVTAGASPVRPRTLPARPVPHAGFGFGMFPNLPELQGIPPAQLFDHMVSGTFKLKDNDNKDLTIDVLAGKVTAASDTSVTMTPNGGGAGKTFTIDSTTRLPGKGSDLKADTKVVVVTKNGGSTAVAIHPIGGRMAHFGVTGTMPMIPGGMDWLHGMMMGDSLRLEIERHMEQSPFRMEQPGLSPQT